MKANQVVRRAAGLHAGGQPGFVRQHGRAKILIVGLAPSLRCKTDVYVEGRAPWQASRIPNIGAPTRNRGPAQARLGAGQWGLLGTLAGNVVFQLFNDKFLFGDDVFH